MDDAIGKWLKQHSWFVVRALPIVVIAVGISLMIGAIKDWDSMYKADDMYHTYWGLGQTSRYWGRKTARIIGFVGGLFFSLFGMALFYVIFFKGK